MACSNVLKKCAFIHWNACFVTSIAFILGVSHLTNTQLDNLQKKYIPKMLNKMGFPCTYLQAVVFSPTTRGRIGSINLRIEQGIMIVIEVMRTLRTPGHGQNILGTFFLTYQHASGLSTPQLKYPDLQATHLEGDYHVYLRKFLAEHKIQLKYACVKRPKRKRENDKFLMDVACAKSKEDLSDADIITIDYCRCYQQTVIIFYNQ